MILSFFGIGFGAIAPAITPATVNELKVNSYLGHWFQVYQAPTNPIFQGYGTCLTADYGLLDNGQISVLNAQLNKKAIFLFMMTFAIMTPAGTYLADILPNLKAISTEITAVVIGILFHISSTIIFESSEGHKFNIAKISMIILGIALAYFI